MPITNGIGHSEQTFDKQVGLAAVLGQHIQIVKRVLDKYPNFPQTYQYIDLYAGSGKNQEENCDGSPVIFLKSIYGRLDYYGHFIDLEPGNTLFLRAATSFTNSHTIYTGDNKEITPKIITRITGKSYGLVYADPNGVPDFDLLALVSEKLPKMDVLIRYPATAAKRNGRSLISELNKVKKGTWIIQKPVGKWQWTFLFGTNYSDYKAWKKFGFYRLDEPEGKNIFEKVVYTKKELETLRQSDLFEKSSRELVFERSGGKCERCKTETVTEIHHKSYKPPVEIPENMIALCHKCHCNIHKVDN